MIKLKHLLLEVSLDQLKTQFVDTGKITDSEFTEIIDSSGGKSAYATWLTKQVVAKRINAEDIYKYNAYFKVFDRRKREYVFNDINQYKTQQDLNSFIVKSIELASQEQKDPSQQKGITKFDKYKEFLIGSVDGFNVYKLPKRRKDLYGTSCELGSGTEWCTATGNTQKYFNSYIWKGPLFIFINPSSNEKYQFSYETNSFMDKNDMPISTNINNLFKFIENQEPQYTAPLRYKLMYDNNAITADDLTVDGDLNLTGTPITSLPDNLTVHGNFILQNTQITSLPDNLTVHGLLSLYNTPITSLPDNLTVNGDLDLDNTQITSLPDNLTVKGYLVLYNTPVSKKYTLDQLNKLLPGLKGRIQI